MNENLVVFNQTERLAKGTFGSVYEARMRLPGAEEGFTTVVAKRIHRRNNEDAEWFHDRVCEEVRVLKLADSEYVVRCHGCFYPKMNERKTAVIVMEKMPYDITTYLLKKSPRGELPMVTRLKVHFHFVLVTVPHSY